MVWREGFFWWFIWGGGLYVGRLTYVMRPPKASNTAHNFTTGRMDTVIDHDQFLFFLSHATMSLDIPFQDKPPVSQERLLLNTHTDDSSLESLCSLCRAVDWSNVTDWDAIKSPPTVPQHLHGTKILVFGNSSRAQLLASRCRVCRLIGHLVNPDLDGALIITYSLKACDYFVESFVDGERSELVKLVVQSPAIGETPDYTQYLLAHNFVKTPQWIRTLQPSLIDFEFFKAKLQLCKNHHKECRPTLTSEAAELYLIDVVTEETVLAKPGWEYIALSYVWGQELSHEHDEKFTPVVQDAMFVTQGLGCRYLWVDRYVSFLQVIYTGVVAHTY